MPMLHHEADDAYLLSLGRFVNEFSVCENMLYRSLVAEHGCSFENATSQLSRLGNKQVIDELMKFDVPIEIDRVLTQFTVIAQARNFILHNGSLFDQLGSDIGISSNFWKQPSRPRTLDVSIPILASLYEDCCVIRHWLLWHQMQKNEEASLLAYLVVQNVATEWKYIPKN